MFFSSFVGSFCWELLLKTCVGNFGWDFLWGTFAKIFCWEFLLGTCSVQINQKKNASPKIKDNLHSAIAFYLLFLCKLLSKSGFLNLGFKYCSSTKALPAMVHTKLATIFNILKAVLSHTHYQNWTALSGVALLVLVVVGQKYPYKCECHQTWIR
jgi:hypothetical protein